MKTHQLPTCSIVNPVFSSQLIWYSNTFITVGYTHTNAHAYKFLSGCKEVENRTLQPCWTSQLPTTSQHHSPTQILPCNNTDIRIHAHTTPTDTDL